MASRLPNSTGVGGRATPSVRAATRRDGVEAVPNAMLPNSAERALADERRRRDVCKSNPRGTPRSSPLAAPPGTGPARRMRSLWPRRQHRRLASWLSTVREQDSSRFGLTPTSYATGSPLALVQLPPAPIRAPRRRRKTMMLQAFGVKFAKGEAARSAASLLARRAMGPGRARQRNGALAAREPQNGHSSTKHHEDPSSYSCIRLTGRSAIRAARLLAVVRDCTGHLAARGDGLQTQLANIDNRCKQRELQRTSAVDPHVAQFHLPGSSIAALRIDAARGATAKELHQQHCSTRNNAPPAPPPRRLC